MVCPQCGSRREAAQGPCFQCCSTRQRSEQPTLSTLPNVFQPGSRVHQGRYGLQEYVARQKWFVGIDETTWLGRDFQDHGKRVLLYDIAFPPSQTLTIQAVFRTTIPALMAVGQHPMHPALNDVLDEPSRVCFVFAFPLAETLQARLSRTRRLLSEQEALEMCGEISAGLELLADQSPPLVHGCIYPEHLFCTSGSPRFLLGPCSPLTAHGDLRFLKGRTAGGNVVYSAPEFQRGTIDGRSDLYSLVATTYYAVTGVIPQPSRDALPPARHFNAALSPEFVALLTKGLLVDPQRRYQHPAELRQDVRAIASRAQRFSVENPRHANAATLMQLSGKQFPRTSQPNRSEHGAVARVSSFSHPFPIAPDLSASATLVPSAEDLPPMRRGNDWLEAWVLFLFVVLGLSLLTAFGSFHL